VEKKKRNKRFKKDKIEREETRPQKLVKQNEEETINIKDLDFSQIDEIDINMLGDIKLDDPIFNEDDQNLNFQLNSQFL